jgi:hypothetical protein
MIQYKIMGTWKAIAVYKFQIITNSGWPSTMTVICRNSQKISQGLSNFKVRLNKGKSILLGWSILNKNSKLIKLGKGSSTSHPGQGLFRHLGSYLIHDVVDPNSFHFGHVIPDI